MNYIGLILSGVAGIVIALAIAYLKSKGTKGEIAVLKERVNNKEMEEKKNKAWLSFVETRIKDSSVSVVSALTPRFDSVDKQIESINKRLTATNKNVEKLDG
ncbi:unnamed protein product, partial [marine sediment metagenome]